MPTYLIEQFAAKDCGGCKFFLPNKEDNSCLPDGYCNKHQKERLSRAWCLQYVGINKCQICDAPWHPATGHVLSKEQSVVLCGRCAKEYYDWYRKRMTQMSHPLKTSVSFAEEMSK